MNQLIQQIKQLRNELGLRYDPDKLVQLYRAIDKLYEQARNDQINAVVAANDRINSVLSDSSLNRG